MNVEAFEEDWLTLLSYTFGIKQLGTYCCKNYCYSTESLRYIMLNVSLLLCVP